MEKDFIENILRERGKKYGKFKEQSMTSQKIKIILRESPNWNSLPKDMQESLDLISTKISRILHGDPNHPDSWQDIIGYSQLIHSRIIAPKLSVQAIEDMELTPEELINGLEYAFCRYKDNSFAITRGMDIRKVKPIFDKFGEVQSIVKASIPNIQKAYESKRVIIRRNDEYILKPEKILLE